MGELRFSRLTEHKRLSSIPSSPKSLSVWHGDSTPYEGSIKEIKLDFETLQQQKRSFLPKSTRMSKCSKSVSFKEDGPGETVKGFTTCNVVPFITGSKYKGQWNSLGMAGKGIYIFPHGVIYDGEFNKNNEFHGSGMMLYPNGSRIEGFWGNGKLLSGTVSSERYVYDEYYCKMPDRRFQIEIETELQPAHQENLTNYVSARVIPEGCYDSGDGFYDPKKRVIINYEDENEVMPLEECDYLLGEERLRNLSPSDNDLISFLQTSLNENDITSLQHSSREIWIKTFCRKAWDEATGYAPELYEIWTAGSKKYDNEKNADTWSTTPTVQSENSLLASYFQHLFGLLRNKDNKGSINSNKMCMLKVGHSPNAKELNETLKELICKRLKFSGTSDNSSDTEKMDLDKRWSTTKMMISKISF